MCVLSVSSTGTVPVTSLRSEVLKRTSAGRRPLTWSFQTALAPCARLGSGAKVTVLAPAAAEVFVAPPPLFPQLLDQRSNIDLFFSHKSGTGLQPVKCHRL